LGLTACGGTDGETDWRNVDVRPDDFALLPCDVDDERPCTLVIAGGKRLLFGAPAGVARAMRSEDLRQLDGVILFSLTAPDLEGLDEVRNLSWHAGRREPLLVIGSSGIEEIATALNKAFEQSDALYVVEHGICTAWTALNGPSKFCSSTKREAMSKQVLRAAGAATQNSK
ncbi:MAG: hypothetical protein AAF384_17710, partial [Pseudomonadota bacterium]